MGTGIAAVTGAHGFLGSRICEALAADGWQVIRLVRHPEPGDSASRRFDLREPVESGALEAVELLVHAAYDLTLTRADDIWAVNVEGTRRLLDAAERARVRRIIVLSTMSAYEGTSQLYGRAKLEIEATTLRAGGCPVRPGLVYSDQPAGMAGALLKVTRLPVVPLVAGDARQYPVHLDDLTYAIAVLAKAEALPSRPIGIAQPTPVTFRTVMSRLAGREGRKCRFVPVPWKLVYGAMRAAERLGVGLPFRADSLLGLVRPAPSVPGVEELQRLGVHLRRFEEAIQ